MTKGLNKMTSQELVARFTALSVAKGTAVMGDEIAKASRLYWQIDAVREELRSREGDQRRLLAPLFRHRDPSVRLNAATSTLAIFPSEARQVLQLICVQKEFPFAGEAGMRLWNLESGVFKPT